MGNLGRLSFFAGEPGTDSKMQIKRQDSLKAFFVCICLLGFWQIEKAKLTNQLNELKKTTEAFDELAKQREAYVCCAWSCVLTN